MNQELEELKKKLQKDIQQSEGRISELQQEIQSTVSERKSRREEWEEYDRLAEGELLELTNEVTGILQRKLQAEELIRYLESTNKQ